MRPCGKDRLLIQVSNIVFIVLTVHNFLSTLILVALELKLHVLCKHGA
jgi:hypothetical protein